MEARDHSCLPLPSFKASGLDRLHLNTASENQVMPISRISSNTREQLRCVIDACRPGFQDAAHVYVARHPNGVKAGTRSIVAASRCGREIRPKLSGAHASKALARHHAGHTKNPLVATMATSGRVARLFDQAALDFATCVAIASINAGDRQS